MSRSLALSTPPTPVAIAEWNNKLNDLQSPSPAEVQQLVIEYLYREGYTDAAKAFQHEIKSEITPLATTPTPLAASAKATSATAAATAAAAVAPAPAVAAVAPDQRMTIRKALQSGDVSRGIQLVQSFDATLLDRNQRLADHLQQQKLLELIRSGDASGALLFAQHSLSTRAAQSPEFLAEMEPILSLLTFPTFDAPNSSSSTAGGGAAAPLPASINELLSTNQRQRMADEVNDAILRTNGVPAESRLVLALQRLVFEQKLAARVCTRVALPTVSPTNPQHWENAIFTPASAPPIANVNVPATPVIAPATPIPSPSPPLPQAAGGVPPISLNVSSAPANSAAAAASDAAALAVAMADARAASRRPVTMDEKD